MDEQIKALSERLMDVDSRLVELIRERFETSEELAKANAQIGFPIPAAQAEREAVARVCELAQNELAGGTEAVFRALLAAQHICHNERSGMKSAAYEQIRATLARTPDMFPQHATVACQGVEGAYSQIACERLFKTPSIMYFDSFEHVFRAVEAGLCKYGVLPIENSTAGSVNAIYDLMTRHNFSIVRSVRLRVSHCLLAKPGTVLSDVREVYSHEQALSQCSEYLAGLKGVKLTAVENTAAAAMLVAGSVCRDVAAIASLDCSKNYGLEILAPDVQDCGGNYTRFICISKEPQIYPGADRVSFMMTLAHKPGTLYNVVSKFYALGINMRKIESRPLPGREFEFMFYFDIEASIYSPEIERLFRELECECDTMRYLGAYSEVIG